MTSRVRHALPAALAVLLIAAPAAQADGVPTYAAHAVLGLGAGVTDPRSLVATDLDGDGRTDLVAGDRNGGAGRLSVLRGLGDGSFGTPLGSPFAPGVTGAGVGAIAAGDLNGDGHPDVLATLASGTTDGDVVLMAGDGTGRLTADAGGPLSVGLHLTGVALADLDADGDLDALTSHLASTDTAQLSSIRNGGPAGLAVGATTGATGTSHAVGLATGQIDGAGGRDALAISRNAGAGSAWVATSTATTMTAGTPVAVGADPVAVALADLDGDGDLDGLVLDGSAPTLTVLHNDGTGVLTPTDVTVTGLAAGSGLATGDLDADGDPDVAITDGAGAAVGVLLGDGAGSFGPATWETTGAGPRSPIIADLTGDGVPDVATADAGSSTISLLRGTSAPDPHGELTGTFGAQAVGRTGEAHTVTITNAGPALLAVQGVSVAGAAADDFLVTHDDCTGASVASGGGAACTVRVRFAPSATGTRTAALRLRSAGGAGFDVALSGTGAAATPAATGTDTDDVETTATATPSSTAATTATTTTTTPPAPAPAAARKPTAHKKPKAAPKRLVLTLTHTKLTLASGKRLGVGLALGRTAKVVLRVKQHGRTVDLLRRTVHEGRSTITWDGMLGRAAAPAGTYRLDVYAVAADGHAARASAVLTVRP
jgi:hypothetical protein